MRNLKECQAEVFRCSEKRIKQRKQRRNHILMVCIPLVLCISVCSAFLRPGDDKTKNSPNLAVPKAEADGTAGIKSESLSEPMTKITVTGTDFAEIYTESSDVQQIMEELFSYATRGPANNGVPQDGVLDESFEDNENVVDNSADSAESATTGYTITLVMREGEIIEYTLNGNELKNLTTKQKHVLSQEQVKELKELLGIPHN